jgi:hypothetical protein
MKLRALVLVSCIILFAAQNSNAQNFQRFGGPVFEVPPIPPLPPLPPTPPLPPHELFGEIAQDPEVSFKQEILRVLLQNNPDRAIDIAADRLKADPADPVVINNLSAIARTSSNKALPLITSIAKTSTDTRARREAINALGRVSSVSLATLEDLYKSNSNSAEVRQAVVSAIGNSSDPRTATVLADIGKNDADIAVRRTAVRLLSKHNGPETTKALEDLLKTAPRGR